MSQKLDLTPRQRKLRKRESNAAIYQSRKQARDLFVDDYKLQHGCAMCGYREHPCALDFHHPDSKHKWKTVAQLKMGGMVNLRAEMRECVVLCANCHRVVHAQNRLFPQYGEFWGGTKDEQSP